MKKIFESAVLGNLSVKNRLVRSATWEGIARQDGGITEEAYKIYDELAKDGVGLVITGFTSVALHDRYFGGMMRLCDDALIPQYKKLTDIIHAQGTPVITQLALGAYYRNLNGSFMQTEPDGMSIDEIHLVREQFIDAAVRADKAGFDGVQLHIAHFFFFLSRFVSPAVNHREDDYGGSIAGRMRLVLEILNGIKSAAPSLHITAKVNSSDFTYGGITEEDCVEICSLLDEACINSIEVSGNGTSVGGVRAHQNEGYFVPAAAAVADAVRCPVIAVGGFRSLDFMEEVLNKTKINFISLSRPLLREPDLPRKMMQDANYISKCVSCNACYSSEAHKCIFSGRSENNA